MKCKLLLSRQFTRTDDSRAVRASYSPTSHYPLANFDKLGHTKSSEFVSALFDTRENIFRGNGTFGEITFGELVHSGKKVFRKYSSGNRYIRGNVFRGNRFWDNGFRGFVIQYKFRSPCVYNFAVL